MSTKPNIALARWADLVGSFVTDAPSGLRDSGFVDATPAEADIVNAELKQLYLWALWLSDGDVAFHNLSATGTLIVAGSTTLNGGLTIATGQAVTLSGTTTLTVGTGAVTFGGLVNANAGITVPTGQVVTLSGTASLTVGGNLTVTGHVSGNLELANSLKVDGTTELIGAVTADATVTTAGALTVGGQTLTFTSFTFTANSGTDQLTATAHPLQTGDGPVQNSNSGGGLPGGLAAVTNYWALRIDANNFKLATSRANAIGGVPIDITSNGTGTQTLAAVGATRVSDAEVTRNLTVDGFTTLTGGITGALSVIGTITPTTITSTSTINDWAPSGFSGAATIRQVVQNAGAGGNVSIGGIAGGSDSRIVVLHALGVQAADTITLLHNSGGSTSGNRFALASGSNLVLPQNGSVALQYDAFSLVWRVFAKNF